MSNTTIVSLSDINNVKTLGAQALSSGDLVTFYAHKSTEERLVQEREGQLSSMLSGNTVTVTGLCDLIYKKYRRAFSAQDLNYTLIVMGLQVRSRIEGSNVYRITELTEDLGVGRNDLRGTIGYVTWDVNVIDIIAKHFRWSV
ncbi:MAG: hypothetical protein ACRCUJ_00570 [Phocaeicola sp.]